MTSTPSGGRPISSQASRSAVAGRSASVSSRRPPGNEISPGWRLRSSRRLVKTTCASPSWTNSGTRTAASLAPRTSRLAASCGSSSTPRRAAASSSRLLGGELDALDTLGEHDLAVERAVDRALGRDDLEALDLLVGRVLGQAQDQLELRGAAALGRRVGALDLDVPEVPALALGVHLDGDRGARGEAR